MKKLNKNLDSSFIKCGDRAIHIVHVVSIDASKIENYEAEIVLSNAETIKLSGIDALEAVMMMKPSLLEGKRLKFKKNMWVIHNLIGHPLMQLLAFFGFYKAAFKIHDATIPKPIFKN